MKVPRVKLDEAADYIRLRKPFKSTTGSLYGVLTGMGVYIVYSYGEHWPLMCTTKDGARIPRVNTTKYGPTTDRHCAIVRRAVGDDRFGQPNWIPLERTDMEPEIDKLTLAIGYEALTR